MSFNYQILIYLAKNDFAQLEKTSEIEYAPVAKPAYAPDLVSVTTAESSRLYDWIVR